MTKSGTANIFIPKNGTANIFIVKNGTANIFIPKSGTANIFIYANANNMHLINQKQAESGPFPALARMKPASQVRHRLPDCN